MQFAPFKLRPFYLAVLTTCLSHTFTAQAEDLNTAIPVNVNLPAQPLAEALKQYAKQSGKNIVFDNSLAKGKLAPAVKGNYEEAQILRKILENSGLEAQVEDGTIVIKREREKLQKSENIDLDKIEVRAKRFYEIGPLPGLGLTKEQIPGNVQSITAKEIKDSHSLSITDLMNKKLQSVTVNDYQGNPFQMDVQYRGFTAGPQIGTPQGLSVFFDGIRVNEPFGDVVNWDMIPMNALAGVDVFPGSNPIFGLNTLGGAFTLKTKDGFNNAGVDAEVLTGSFGRKQLQVEGGVNNGTFALFGAGNFFLEDGWRENSPSKVNQFFGKASYRGDKLDLNLSTLWVGTDLVGNGLLPTQMYDQDRNGSYTSEDETTNRLQQFQLSGAFQATDTFSITGQVYRRNSDRKQIGADVMADYDEELLANRIPAAGEQYTCLFNSSGAGQYGPNSAANLYGLPDYIVLPIVNYDPVTSQGQTSWWFDAQNPDGSGLSAIFQDLINGTFNPANYADLINKPLDPDFLASYQYSFKSNANFYEQQSLNRDGGLQPVPFLGEPSFFGEPAYFSTYGGSFAGNSRNGGNVAASLQDLGGVMGDESNYFFSQDQNGVITKNFVLVLSPANKTACYDLQSVSGTKPEAYNIPNPISGFETVDGRAYGTPGVIGVTDPATGKVFYTPTALLNNNQIDQVVDGFSMQLNWNLDKHKFMVGVSLDSASADYKNSQRLGLLDANRRGYLAPDQIHPMFTGAFVPLENNNFEGTSNTKSIYFSETWTPTPAWNFNASGRYNATQVKNKIAARRNLVNFGIGDMVFQGLPSTLGICPNADCTNVPTNFRIPDLFNVLDSAETEKFSFYSFNPSLGATWQAKENLNVYTNWSQGTRTPSVVELGCAFDKTPIRAGFSDPDGDGIADTPFFVPKSIFENRQCTLPTTLSGDPFLPQIKATSYDIGMRGELSNLLGDTNLQWNLGAYQTDLKDDIYFVAVGNGAGFFDTIGKTRRRGLEAGLSGKKDKWGFGINYALTDATFENNFRMISIDNSSSTNKNDGFGEAIDVKKGSRLPGVALHNLNASISYEVTPKWQVGLSAVAHSKSFVRGNENNEHRKGVTRVLQTYPDGSQLLGRKTTNDGTVPGYATFNFQTSYKFNNEWTGTLLVNNVFDREYFTAGRLGRNAFSPSINGAIGVSGYNHNSGDWLSTNFIAPGAPRGVWFSLNWQFDPNAKPSF